MFTQKDDPFMKLNIIELEVHKLNFMTKTQARLRLFFFLEVRKTTQLSLEMDDTFNLPTNVTENKAVVQSRFHLIYQFMV